MYEGGYRVPAILRWPGHARAGTDSAEAVSFVDLLPTLCAAAGATPPADRVLDGVNVLPILEGRPVDRPHPLAWQFDFAKEGPWTLSLRRGPWKLLADAQREHFALYNLVDDVGEQRDRAAERPDLVKDLRSELDQFRFPPHK
jgi:arylsulfatase A